MNADQFNSLKVWFHEYSKSFLSPDEEYNKNISLKIQHTYHVCENIVQISREQLLSDNEIMLAETIALFHDVGRFRQYQQYRTFKDIVSVNHGKLGAEILGEEGILNFLDREEQELITSAVKFHNTFALPHLENPGIIIFLKLIRDADKLDIWRVFSEYFEADESERASAAGLGLPDTPSYSEKILSCIYKKKMASLADLQTQNDFRLMQLSWIYDLNFSTSFRLLLERDYINRIGRTLPQSDVIVNILLLLHEFSARKAVRT